MAYTPGVYPGLTGAQQDFSVPFEYISRDYVKVTVDGTPVPFSFLSTYMIRIDTAPVGNLRIFRETPGDPINVYADSSILIDDDLNLSFLQSTMVAEEAVSNTSDAVALFDETLDVLNDAVALASTADDRSIDALSTANTALTNANDAVVTADAALAAMGPAVAQAEAARDDAEAAAEAAEGLVGIAQTALQPIDILDPAAFGAVGDGVTNDTAAFAAMEAVYSGRVADLRGKTYLVTGNPFGNTYVNGFWKLSEEMSLPQDRGKLYPADDDPAVISAASGGTGGYGNTYSGGVSTPTAAGRSTRNRQVLVGSQNSLVEGSISGIYSSIYCWNTFGAVQAQIASRQSIAGSPQAVNVASEEAQCLGGGGFNGAAHFSITNGVKCSNVSTRLSQVTAVRYGVNVATNTCFAGGGYNAVLTPVISGGTVSLTIDNGGVDFTTDHTIRVTPRQGSVTTIASFAVSAVDANGAITAVTPIAVGAGYSDGQAVTVDISRPSEGSGECAGNYSAFLSRARGKAAVNAATIGGKAIGDYSFNLGSDGCTQFGSYAGAIGSRRCVSEAESGGSLFSADCTIGVGATNGFHLGSIGNSAVTASRSGTIASGGGTASGGQGALVIGGSNAHADHLSTLVMAGRRLRTISERTTVWGDANAGSALTANRKVQIIHTTGSMAIAGSLTSSNVFADFAEVLENKVKGEIPVGALVALDGDKVRLAQSGDPILGVRSKTAAFVAGDTPFQWAQRHLLGKHGEVLMVEEPDGDWEPMVPDPSWNAEVPNPEHPKYEVVEIDLDDGERIKVGQVVSTPTIPNPEPQPLIPNPEPQKMVLVPVENPEFDPTADNTPRSERVEEWTVVGLLGQVYVNVDETVRPGDFIKAGADGVGTRADASSSDTLHGVRCMRMSSEFDAADGYAVAFCMMR